MRIKLLSPLLANQIAAGEVIERPASVLKEILENSLDAKATRLEIDLEKGGTQLVRVRDDGVGIHAEDLGLALRRHATSKISELADLERIVSLGFRGEALASITSVAKVCVQSCAQGQEKAWQVRAEGAEICGELAPVAHPPGTTIEVRNLFFNTPVRRRFLRTEKTEFEHINEVVKRIALSRFDVAFTLRHNQRVVYQLPIANSEEARGQRIAKLCSSSFLDNSLYIDVPAMGLRLWGWLGLPDSCRNQADLQYFYVNGRVIRDKLVSHAVRQAYSEQLYPGKYPRFVLFLECDPATVDVNVHPTKHEVRFHEARQIHSFIEGALRDLLQMQHNVQELLPVTTTVSTNVAMDACVLQTEDAGASVATKAAAMPMTSVPSATDTMVLRPPLFPARPLIAGHAQSAIYQTLRTPKVTSSVDLRQNTALIGPLGKSLRQIQGRFLLAENVDGLVLINLTLAWQAMAVARWQQALQTSGIKRQPLLVPLSLQLGSELLKQVESRQALLQRLGIDVQLSGPNTVLVRQIPSLLANTQVGQWLTELLQTLKSYTVEVSDEQLGSVLQSLAASAVATATAHMPLTECDNLLREMEALDPATKSWYHMLNVEQLEKIFQT